MGMCVYVYMLRVPRVYTSVRVSVLCVYLRVSDEPQIGKSWGPGGL